MIVSTPLVKNGVLEQAEVNTIVVIVSALLPQFFPLVSCPEHYLLRTSSHLIKGTDIHYPGSPSARSNTPFFQWHRMPVSIALAGN